MTLDSILEMLNEDSRDEYSLEGFGDIMKSIGGGIKWVGGKLLDMVRKFFKWIGDLFGNILKKFKGGVQNVKGKMANTNSNSEPTREFNDKEKRQLDEYRSLVLRLSDVISETAQNRYGSSSVGYKSTPGVEIDLFGDWISIHNREALQRQNIKLDERTDIINTAINNIKQFKTSVSPELITEFEKVPILSSAIRDMSDKYVIAVKRAIDIIDETTKDNKELQKELEAMAKIIDEIDAVKDEGKKAEIFNDLKRIKNSSPVFTYAYKLYDLDALSRPTVSQVKGAIQDILTKISEYAVHSGKYLAAVSNIGNAIGVKVEK